MLPLVSDEDFDGRVLRAMFRQHPELDVVRVQDVGLRMAPDPDILAWAANEGRIVITRDRSTMSKYAYERVAAGLRMPGVFVTSDMLSIGRQAHELLILALCSADDEWEDQVVILPL